MTGVELRILTLADFDGLLERSARCGLFIFKHSTACPTSAAAHREFERFLDDSAPADSLAAMVRVIEERPISKAIEARLGVAHASPQVIWLRDGKALASLSHGAITAPALAALTRL